MQQTTTALEEVFLGELSTLSSKPWFITAQVNGTDVKFKVDTGADITAVPRSALPGSTLAHVQQPTKVLYGPGRTVIGTVGQLRAEIAWIAWNGHSTRKDIFVIRSLQNTLLGRPVVRALDVLSRIVELEEDKDSDPIVTKYSGMFRPLGHTKTVYGIKLVPGTTPYAVNYSRRV